MKKLVLTATIILGFAMGSFAQGYYNRGGLFYRGMLPGQQMRDDEAGLYLPGDGIHGLFGNADGTDTNYDETEWDWQSHFDTPLGNGALLLVGFGAAYALSKRKKKD